MLTMYEKLMTLPIFHGVGTEQLSNLLEKIPLEFKRYEAGELLAAYNEECDRIKCVMSGEVMTVYTLAGGKMQLYGRYGAGKVIGLDRLYGMTNLYGHAVQAITSCSTFELTKNQYIGLIKKNNVCLINFLNYLSYKSQKREWTMHTHLSDQLVGKLASLVAMFSDRDVIDVTIKGMENLVVSENKECRNQYDRDLMLLKDWGLVKEVENNPNILLVPSRNSLLDYAEDLNEDKI